MNLRQFHVSLLACLRILQIHRVQVPRRCRDPITACDEQRANGGTFFWTRSSTCAFPHGIDIDGVAVRGRLQRDRGY